MTELLRLIVDVFGYLWPFRPVDQWERGCYYVLNVVRREVGPGVWPVVPYFMDVRSVSVVPDPIIGPRQDVTLADGTTAFFNASVIVRVEDVTKALNEIHDFETATREIMARTVGMRLQSETADKLTPEERGRFLAGLLTTIDTQTKVFGVRVSSLAFPSFVMHTRTYRLVGDNGGML